MKLSEKLKEKGNLTKEIIEIVAEIETLENTIKMKDDLLAEKSLKIEEEEEEVKEEPKLTYQTSPTKVKVQYNGDETEVEYREHWKVGNKQGTKVFRKILDQEPKKETGVKVVKITLSEKDFFVTYTA